MPLNYQGSGVRQIEFKDFGLTSSICGVTTTVSLFEPSTGSVFETSFSQKPNYVLATGLSATISNKAFQTISVLSLKTVENYPITVSLFGAQNSYIEAKTVGPIIDATIRVLRGDTVIGEAKLDQKFESTADEVSIRYSPSSFSFLDFPSVGAATYSLQASTNGSCQISFRNISMFVRQL